MKPKANQYERYKKIFENERLPLAFVDLDNFDRNIGYVAGTQKDTGKTIRIHTKSLRCLPLIKRILSVGGPSFRGIMTFSMEETTWLAGQGLDDFIVAYPTVQPSDLRLFCELAKAGKRVSLMVDSSEHLRILSEAGHKAGVTLNACLEVDLSYRPLGSLVHLGPRRSPVRSAAEALDICRLAQELDGVAVIAVMGYEAHIASVNDAIPGAKLRNLAIMAMKKASISELTDRRIDIVKRLMELGVKIVNGGGSGSLVSTGHDSSVTEVTAGSAFYAPGLFWHFKDVSFAPAAFFAVQMVRKPTPGMVTCHGGGYVASGAAGADKLPTPVYPEGLKLTSIEGAGEVQTPLVLTDPAINLKLGDPVFFQHAKAGELAERFNEFLLIQEDRIVERVKTYRGEGRAFL